MSEIIVDESKRGSLKGARRQAGCPDSFLSGRKGDLTNKKTSPLMFLFVSALLTP